MMCDSRLIFGLHLKQGLYWVACSQPDIHLVTSGLTHVDLQNTFLSQVRALMLSQLRSQFCPQEQGILEVANVKALLQFCHLICISKTLLGVKAVSEWTPGVSPALFKKEAALKHMVPPPTLSS